MSDQKEKTRRSPRRLLKGFGFLVICGLIIAAVVYLPIFTVQRVEIHGNSYLSDTEIMKIGRIYPGEPLFKLQTDAITQDLQQDLRIESAFVRRRMPDTLEIDVTERQAVATVACDYGYVDLDRLGKVLNVHRTLSSVPIPLITGVTLGELYVGDDNPDQNIARVISFLQLLDPASLNQLSEVNIAQPGAVAAYTTHGVQIRLGSLDHLEEKAALTQDFLKDLQTTRHAIEYVDFSYAAPFIRLRDVPVADPEKNGNNQ